MPRKRVGTNTRKKEKRERDQGFGGNFRSFYNGVFQEKKKGGGHKRREWERLKAVKSEYCFSDHV